MTTDTPNPFAVRHGLTFLDVLVRCCGTPEFVAEYDRLNGSNLSCKGAPIDLIIDKATGRIAQEFDGFVKFCWEFVFLRF